GVAQHGHLLVWIPPGADADALACRSKAPLEVAFDLLAATRKGVGAAGLADQQLASGILRVGIEIFEHPPCPSAEIELVEAPLGAAVDAKHNVVMRRRGAEDQIGSRFADAMAD